MALDYQHVFIELEDKYMFIKRNVYTTENIHIFNII